MKETISDFGIGLCGLFTVVAAAIGDVLIARATSVDLFSYMVLFVMPVGAVIVGLAAASGYYFGALYLQKTPRWSLLFQMVLNAAIAQCLIYYIGYSMLVVDGIKATDAMSFGQYLDAVLTKAHYVSKRGEDGGEVGSLGYWIAADQFIGVLLGGMAFFLVLIEKPVCRACRRYLRRLAKSQKFFINARTASNFHRELWANELGSEGFAALMLSPHKRQWRALDGIAIMHTSLLECPLCKKRTFEQKVLVTDGRSCKEIEHMRRRELVPDDVELLAVFRH